MAESISIDSYADWRVVFFSEADALDNAVSGVGADPDGDEFTNLAEYALGGNPTVQEANLVEFDFGELASPEEDDVSLSFNWANDVTDAAWAIERSVDLENWEAIDPTNLLMEPNGADFTRISATVPMPLDSADSFFLRLQVREAASL